WVNKVYDESGSTDGNDTKWTITINTNGMTLKNLTMYDKFSGDATLIIKDSNLSISGAGVTSSDYTVDTTGGTTYSWKATFNKDINGTITIEYVTTIQDYEQYLRENHKTAPTNTAWITYDYVDGNGTSHRDIKGPTVEKKASIVTNAGIDITKVSYDPATHKITWHVVANKNKQALTNAVITDVIPSNQDYDEVKNANQDWISTSGNTLTMNLGDALKNTIVEFDIITKVKDDNVKDWSLNATNKTDYKQQVELDTEQQQDVKSDVAIATVASEVLKVYTPKYEYSTHIATFTATIDNNEMMMDNIHLITTIKDFELLDGLKIDSTPVTDTYYKYNKDTGALDITVPAVTKEQVGDATTGKRVVSFKAHVNDDKYKDTNNADVSIPVTFTLKTADLDNKNLKQDEAVTLKFNNVILLKDFDFDTSKNLASYKVIINGAKNMLSENLVVEDTLGTSLVLDTSSVKLYVSSINSTTGAISTDSGLEEVSPSRYTVTTKEEGSKTKLVVKMPSDAGDRVYVLKYDAIAQDKKDLNNSVSMYDLVTTTVKKFSSNKTISASLFNDAFAKAAVRLTVTTKTTEDTSDFDSPIIVNVLDSTGKTVTKLKVPINGKATSIGKLKTDGGTYKLVVDESSVPKGYDAPAQKTVTPTTSNTNVSQEFSFEKKHIDDLTFVVQDRESKKDITATNTVVDKNNKTATAFKYGEEFTVKEGNPPYGYRGGKSGKFTINNDGTITVTGDDIAIEGKEIILYDDSLAGNEILISKVSSNGVLLKDAKLKITHVSTSTVAYDSIITKGEKLELKLPEGKYKLEEISAPYGYNVASSITFEIDSDGKVLVNDADVNGEIVMVDTDKPSEYLSVDDIFGEIPTSDGDTQLAVFEYTGDDFDPTTATPVVKLYDDSEDNSTPVDTTKLVIKPQTKYFITDVKKLASFDPSKTRFFDVFIEKNNITSDSKTNNNTTTRATTNGGSNATATPKKKISISDGGSTPKEYVLTDNPTGDEVANVLKPEDFFQEIIPKAPVIPPGDYYVYRNNSTEEAARPAAPIATPVVENPVVDLQQDIAQSNNETNQKKLTQTGGFIGALTGYATGIILLLIGIFLYIGGDSKGKKKR
ncbi:MAG: hypothetical protein IKW81_10725, partial [Pseudobutyrivibrio sp.]|nr:hypothetical protein [Pseudobutyrivibrio sp.]